MTVHLTLLALAELAPASRWWGDAYGAAGRKACSWRLALRGCDVINDEDVDIDDTLARNRVSCPACLVLLDAALEMSPANPVGTDGNKLDKAAPE